jgi:transposase
MDIAEFPQRLNNKHRFTANERLFILAEWEEYAATGPDVGAKSAFCRRAGVSTESLSRWIIMKRNGLLIETDKRQTRFMLNKQERLEFLRLQKENAILKAQLEQSESAVEVLGKASELLSALAKSSQIRTPPLPDQQAIPAAFRKPTPKPNA